MQLPLSLAAAGLALAALLPAPVPAQDAAAFDPTPHLGKDWYGVYVQGKKSGCAEHTRTKATRGDTPTIVLEMRISMKLRGRGEQIEMRRERRNIYAANGGQELLESSTLESRGEKTLERSGTREKDGFLIRTRQDGRETERETVPLPRETLSDALSSERLVTSGAKPGTKWKNFSFALDDGKEFENENELIGVEDGFADGVKAKVVVVRQTSGKTGEHATARLSPEGKPLELEFGGLVKIRLEPEALAKDTEYSADLFTRSLLPVSGKLGHPKKVRALTLRLRGASEDLKLPSVGRQTVTKEADGALLLVLVSEVAREKLPAATEQECKDALRSTAEYACSNPEIQALARHAVGDASTPEEKVRRLVPFVGRYVEDVSSHAAISAIDVLRDRRGDCTEHAMLFIALCRAAGVPAREASGLMYAGDELAAFGGHAWAEVALDGRWVSADPTWEQFPVDATHIKLDEAGGAENMMRLMNTSVKAEVVSVEKAK